MRIKLAPLATTARGRHGGVVATKGRGSETIRRFTHPVNTQSQARTEARNAFANLQHIYTPSRTYIRLLLNGNPPLTTKTHRNRFIGLNQQTMTGKSDLTSLRLSSSDVPNLTIRIYAVNETATEIVLYSTDKSFPAGWTCTHWVAWIIRDGDFRTLLSPDHWVQGASTRPYANLNCPVVAPIKPATYLVGAFIRAYDPSGAEWHGNSNTQLFNKT